MTPEERITRLEDIEQIRQLQAKYQRCLDTRAWDEMEECFTQDARSSYDNGAMSYEGKENVMGFLKDAMTVKMPSTHLIHGGEIDITSPSEAKATWYLEDYLLHRKYKMKLHGAAIYYVNYRKEEMVWKICSIGYKRCYQYFEARTLMNLLTLGKTTFLDALKKKKQ